MLTTDRKAEASSWLMLRQIHERGHFLELNNKAVKFTEVLSQFVLEYGSMEIFVAYGKQLPLCQRVIVIDLPESCVDVKHGRPKGV